MLSSSPLAASYSVQEMRCLQAKYHDLEKDCQAAVRNYTSITMTDPTLDFYLMKACESVIQEFCSVRGFTDRLHQRRYFCSRKRKSAVKTISFAV